jgi:hypothetical protein
MAFFIQQPQARSGRCSAHNLAVIDVPHSAPSPLTLLCLPFVNARVTDELGADRRRETISTILRRMTGKRNLKRMIQPEQCQKQPLSVEH